MDKDLRKFALKDLKSARRVIRKILAEENSAMSSIALSSIGHIDSIDPFTNNDYYENMATAIDVQQDTLEAISGALDAVDFAIEKLKGLQT